MRGGNVIRHLHYIHYGPYLNEWNQKFLKLKITYTIDIIITILCWHRRFETIVGKLSVVVYVILLKKLKKNKFKLELKI